MEGSSAGGRSMCLSLHLSWLFSRYFSRSLRSLLGLQLLLLERYLDFPLFLSQVLERDLERDLCLRFLSLLRLRLLFLFLALTNKNYISAVDFHLRQCQQPRPSPQTHKTAKTFPPDTQSSQDLPPRHIKHLPMVTAPLLALLVCTRHQSFEFFQGISCHLHIIFIQHSLQEQKTVGPFCKRADKKPVTNNWFTKLSSYVYLFRKNARWKKIRVNMW